MYSGFNKGDGSIIGTVQREEAVVDLGEATATSSADEAILCSATRDAHGYLMI